MADSPDSAKLFDNSGMDPNTPLNPSEIGELHKLEAISFPTHESKGKISSDTYIHIDDQPQIKLPCGHLMPVVGLGTWKSAPGEVKEAVKMGIKAGYRHIDCAAIYQNEQEIGEALKEIFDDGVVSRQDLFLTSKLWNSHHDPQLVQVACEKSLKDLGISQLDLYLIHWPSRPDPATILGTWTAMEALVDKGLTKSIGISNFSIKKLQVILDSNPKIKPSVSQIECHPYFRNTELLNYCVLNDIHVTAYSPLGSPDSAGIMKRDPNATGPMSDPVVIELAKKLNKTPAQILIRLAIQRGCSVLPKSVQQERLKSNLDVFNWTLSQDDMNALLSLKTQCRMVAGAFLVESGAFKSLEDLWDEEP